MIIGVVYSCIGIGYWIGSYLTVHCLNDHRGGVLMYYKANHIDKQIRPTMGENQVGTPRIGIMYWIGLNPYTLTNI